MSRHSAIARAIAIAILMTACAVTASQTGPSTNGVIAATDSKTIQTYQNAPSETVHLKSAPTATLDAVRAAYAVLGVDIRLDDPSTGQVGNNNLVKMHKLAGVPLSEYFGCGDTMTGPAADSYSLTMSLVSHVSPEGTGSRVDTQAQARAQNITSSNGSVRCETRGRFEAKLNALLSEKIGG
jgi:hypothetical protein